ncbi:sensor histidine kinase [Streptomyces sp. TRM66268-LWL]|uniref:histidine kinase n=1 Tax=Streptomyces polyasparticus TaxID=2767826 RepID=A0ABR7SC48_9ACTN|nr:sensor histidine kinase [Streptomyces polyasparticus]
MAPGRLSIPAARLSSPAAPVYAAAALALAALAELTLRTYYTDGRFPPALFLALGMTVPLAAVRTQPLWSAVITAASALLALAPYHLFLVAGLPSLLLCLYAAGRHGPRLPSTLLPLPFLGYAVAGPGDRLATVLVCLSALAAAVTGLTRRALAEARAHSATERAIAETLQEHAARGERARIARELHDVVAHHISMIAVQAETARLTTAGMPPAGAERLLAIGDTARTALTEMRRLLGVLREDAEAPPTRRPQPGLQELAELVDEAREAGGGATRLIVSGRIRPLDQGVELTAYRIVQEALSNARRHAPGAAVDVTLHYTDAALHLRIRDNGPGPKSASARGGHGLTGMRERAAMVGGSLASGPALGGGFRIEARLPAPAAQGSGGTRTAEAATSETTTLKTTPETTVLQTTAEATAPESTAPTTKDTR